MDSPGIIVPFGRYVLKERLAQGGMGEVFRAVAVGEHGFEKPVVVKRVLPAHAGREDLTELFVAEAKLMTRLSHPNIVEVLDFGRGEHKDYYLVLELVDGTDLGRLLRAHAARGELFPIPLALFVASQLLRGLHHAHTLSAGEGGVIVHRDVSPSNVLCSAEGEVKVADFGVALVTHAGGGGDGGGAGVAGKPGYMAPEQFDGGVVDPRADVFSAGVVLHQMLTGTLPFRGETPEAQQAAARLGQRMRARDLRGDVDEAVEAIVGRALAPSPDARFPDARAMAQAIERLRDQGQRIAGGDDLAEAVQAAQRELPPPGRRVIALSSASPAGHAANAAPDSLAAPSELTRTGAPGGVGAFTLRFPVRADATTRQRDGASEPASRAGDRWSKPEPRTERIVAVDHPPPSAALLLLPAEAPPGEEPSTEPDQGPHDGPRQRALRLAASAAVAAVALLGVLAFVKRPAGRSELHVPSGSPAPLASSPPPPPPSGPEPSATLAVTAAPVLHGSVRPAPARTPASASPLAAASPAVPAEGCAGDVAIFSHGSWIVTGGPRTVESPATPVWPCGTFTLVARSRQDPALVKSATITVGPKARTVWDLR